MPETSANPRPGSCPQCGASIAVPEFLAGMWSGAKRNGMPAGGGVHEATCPECAAALEAYNDVYDDFGNVIVTDALPELIWRVKRTSPPRGKSIDDASE